MFKILKLLYFNKHILFRHKPICVERVMQAFLFMVERLFSKWQRPQCFYNYKHRCLIHTWSDKAITWSDKAITWSDKAITWSDKAITWSDKAIKGTVVNREFPSLHEGSIENSRTFPLRYYIISYSMISILLKYIWIQNETTYLKENSETRNQLLTYILFYILH